MLSLCYLKRILTVRLLAPARWVIVFVLLAALLRGEAVLELCIVCDIPRAGAKETDIFGRLLLHRVCEHKAPVEVVDALLAAYPDGKPIESVLFVELC